MSPQCVSTTEPEYLDKIMNISKTTFTAIAGACLFTLATQADDKVKPGAEAKVQLEGAKVGHWTMDYDAAVKLAKEKKIPMMLNFTGSDWCGWCKLMDKSVFAKEDWVKYAEKNAILVTLDFPNDKAIVPEKYVSRNTELKEKFGVGGFPTYVVLDSDGKTKLGQLGAGRDKTPESFIEEFKGVIQLSAANIAAYAKKNPDKADAYKKAIADSAASKKALADWIATRPERNDENTRKFETFQKSITDAETKLKGFR